SMPHKKIPVGSDNIDGLARLVRSNDLAGMENMALWHERDISHSSVERIIGPDSTILVDFMLHRLTGIISDLVVYPGRMTENLNRLKGLIFSQQLLIKLSQLGMSRQAAYDIVQRNALKVWETGKDFKSHLLKDEELMARVSAEEIDEIFSVDYHLKYVDEIFSRVFE
ncbi:MAG: adenylosuccinate lyase, partial [Deltaproteobacteria bacterium]